MVFSKDKSFNAPDPCAKAEPLRSRQYTGGPDIEYVTVNFPNAGTANIVDRDVLVQFNRPWKFIGVASITNAAKSVAIFVHFVKLGLSIAAPGNTIAEVGTEQWIALANSVSSTANGEARWIRFSAPVVKQFYVDADHGFGVVAGGYFITFFGTNDIEFMTGERL